MELTSKDTLKALMKQRGFSYERLARYAGCHKSFIGALAIDGPNGKRSCTTDLAENIAEALEVPLEILFVPRVPTSSGQNPNRLKASA